MIAPFTRAVPAVVVTLLACTSLVAGCARGEAATDSDARSSSIPHRVVTITGARDPESVRYDPDQDVFLISMMAGYGSYKDNNGYIVRMSAANPGQPTVFVEARKNGVTLKVRGARSPSPPKGSSSAGRTGSPGMRAASAGCS